MLINKLNISEFNTIVYKVDIQPVLDNEDILHNIELLIKSPDQETGTKWASKMIAEAMDCMISDLGDGMKYKCTLVDARQEYKGVDFLEEEHVTMLTLTFKVKYKQSEMRHITIEGETELYNDGVREMPCVIILEPSTSLETITIKGFKEDITVRNLTEGKTIVIDSKACTVMEDGVNKFNDYHSWRFPTLAPGENTIIVPEGVKATIVCAARWF